MDEQLKANIKRQSIWLRLVYMLVLTVAFNIAELVIFAVVVFQFLSSLISGRSNEQLQCFGRNAGSYLRDIVAYLTFATDDKPYPFAPWPNDAEPEKPTGTKEGTDAAVASQEE
jgi:hypothetical protein